MPAAGMNPGAGHAESGSGNRKIRQLVGTDVMSRLRATERASMEMVVKLGRHTDSRCRLGPLASPSEVGPGVHILVRMMVRDPSN